jgi:hypothetical protein
MVEPKVLKKLSKKTTDRILEKKREKDTKGQKWKNVGKYENLPPNNFSPLIFWLILRFLFLNNFFHIFDLAILFYHKNCDWGNICFLKSLGFFQKEPKLKICILGAYTQQKSK